MLAVGHGITIHGHITFEGPPDSFGFDRSKVYLQSVDNNDFLNSAGDIKKDGQFEFFDVADGNYKLFLLRNNREWYIKSARVGSDDVLDSGVQVESGRPVGTLEVVLSHGSAELEGQVTDDGKPVVGARVHIRPDPETPYNRIHQDSASTDQTGHFVLTRVPPGTYRVAKLPTEEEAQATSEPQVVTISESEHRSIQLSIKRDRNR